MRDTFFCSVMCWVLILSLNQTYAQGLSLNQTTPLGPKQVIIKLSSGLSTGGFDSIDRGGTYSSLSAVEKVDFINAAENATGRTVTHVREMWGRADVFVIDGLTDQQDFADTMALLTNMNQIRFVQEDSIATTTVTPNDPQYPQQWHYYEPTAGMNLPDAWDITTGSPVTVAVVDTGYRNHIDMNSKILPGYDMISSAFRANDGDGRDSDPLDVAPRQIPGFGLLYHGIHVAGTVTTSTNNNRGVAGVSWGARILPVRVLSNVSGGTQSDIIDGIAWAAGLTVPGVPQNQNPAKVINLSLASINPSPCAPMIQQVINAADAAGAFIVAGAGNNDELASRRWPANCNKSFVVAGISRGADKAYYSNFGNLSEVDVAAPGGEDFTAAEGVLSLGGANDYVYLFGTSMSTPHVSGLAALLLSVDSQLTPQELRNLIKNNSRPFPRASTCDTTLCGSGIADAKLALEALSPDPGLLVRMVASYLPGPPERNARREYVLNTEQSPIINFYYDEASGSFQERPGGACHTGQNNQTYFMIKIDSPQVESCSFQASWDNQPIQCNENHLATANNGDWVIINTDSYETNPATCELFQPLRPLVPPDTHVWFEVNLEVDGEIYTRRMNFRKIP
ncbi:S8 family peptidase [Marinicella sp. W31]|uniref:S8 family peptidase n=1 Tax=Marinicella sp. W31 TaxID=3023713 RepID=UPI003757D8AC